MMRNTTQQQKGMQGFTLVELMVATMVFAMVLLLITVAVVQINRVYYKGVTEANTQNVARDIVDVVSQAIQFDAGSIVQTPDAPPAGAMQTACAGSQQFVFWPGYRLVEGSPGTNEVTQAFILRSATGNCANPAPLPDGSIDGRELLSTGMRVSKFDITQVGGTNLYRLSVTVVFGDDASLNNPTSTTPTCRSIQQNNEFCSVATINTVVEKRVE